MPPSPNTSSHPDPSAHSDAQDPRQFPRVFKNLKITYWDGKQKGSAQCLSISLGGLFLQVSEKEVHTLGDILELAFLLPGESDLLRRTQVNTFAQVLRRDTLQSAGPGKLPGLALEFVGRMESRQDLKRYLESQLGAPLPSRTSDPEKKRFKKPDWADTLPLLPSQIVDHREKNWPR